MLIDQHEHLPPAGYVQALPTIVHRDIIGDDVQAIVLMGFPALVRALNLIREDNGGPSWPPEEMPHIAARWAPYLHRMEAAVAALSDSAPAPEDVDTLARIAAGAAPCYLDSELYTFCNGECTAMDAVANRTPDLRLASNFLNDFFEGWSYYEDGPGFDPAVARQ